MISRASLTGVVVFVVGTLLERFGVLSAYSKSGDCGSIEDTDDANESSLEWIRGGVGGPAEEADESEDPLRASFSSVYTDGKTSS